MSTGLTKYVLVPLATIGCGKTTVFLTLQKLFPEWVHLQNDNVKKGGSRYKLIDGSLQALKEHPVVLFDRNNSSAKERKQIFEDFEARRSKFLENEVAIKFIAVSFIEDISDPAVWDITYKRIKERGDNHQSIKSATDPATAVMVMRTFIKRYQPLWTNRFPDNQFDSVIQLRLKETNSSLDNTKVVINHLAQFYPELVVSQPTNEEIEAAFRDALDYKPSFTKVMSKEGNKNASPKKQATSAVRTKYVAKSMRQSSIGLDGRIDKR
ncbi:tRNA ligase kinase domain-containing protein [Scheffersomyces xylosifermentans]|uniref:tRNA ligase kinase domain-containing protein n=1 Tax=Scheffersomyces xylosifermentans TaxID=1304137 RepID=UPI00315D5E3A